MKKKDLKKDYKDAIKMTLKNIERNVDDIVDIAFNNKTQDINVNILIEPDKLVSWSLRLNMLSSEGDLVKIIRGADIDGKKN